MIFVANISGRQGGQENTRVHLAEAEETDRHIIEVERAKFALLVEESNDFISMSDFEGNCTFLNAAGRHLVGLERGEEKGKRVRDFVFKEDWAVAEEALRTAVRKGSWQGEGRMRNFRTGRSVPVHGSFFTLKDPTGQPFAIAYVCRDLTFTHEREEQIRQAQKMEAIGKLAGGVAHDFNNLLTAINGYSDMLLEITPEGDSRREFLLEIRGSGQRAASLTSQLLAYSRKQVLRPQVLQLNTVVEEGARLLKRIIGETIEMRLRLDSDLLPVMADPNQIHQILFNLILNARDAMPNGGILTLSTRNAVLAERRESRHGTLAAGRYGVLEVADTGIGMTEDVQAQIFEPFFTTKDVGKGTGLGLSSVYGILQQSGGGIEVESRPGEGSVFRIHLPVLEMEEKAKAAQDQDLPYSVPGRGRILLVEDEEAVRKFVRSHLESLGYSVVEARNGLEAMASLSSQDSEPDLLLTDVVMPRMGGARLAESVRILRPHLPILFMSGYAEEMLNMKAEGTEQIQYLQKPFSAGTLARKIEEMIRLDAPHAR
ncbi:MAG TPA: ATP-binding protein [Fibrobacteria bacterium]|nr:ATP-binding protein [Fibrobacteria bacterium]